MLSPHSILAMSYNEMVHGIHVIFTALVASRVYFFTQTIALIHFVQIAKQRGKKYNTKNHKENNSYTWTQIFVQLYANKKRRFFIFLSFVWCNRNVKKKEKHKKRTHTTTTTTKRVTIFCFVLFISFRLYLSFLLFYLFFILLSRQRR